MSLDAGDFDMQPLNRVKKVDATDWGSNHRVMQKRATLAAKVAQSIAFWAEIEVLLGMFLACVLHANEKAVLAIYTGLENRAAQLRMIESASTAALNQNHADVVSVVLNVLVRPAMRYRDKLAHWCWGFTDELPDALLIRDQEQHLVNYAATLRLQGETGRIGSGVPVNFDSIFVVRDGDLDSYLSQLEHLELTLRRLMASVWIANSAAEHAEHLRMLSSEPRIQAGLEKLRKGRQSNRDTQQQTPALAGC